MFIYIDVDSNGYVKGSSTLSGEVIDPFMILVSDTSEADGNMWDFNNLQWIPDDRPPVVYITPLDSNGFRDRFGYTGLMQVDRFEDNLEDDVAFDAKAVNSTPATRDSLRDPIRTGFKDMRAMSQANAFDISDGRVIRFFDALVAAGVITQQFADTFLDTTDLEQ